ncbi:MAG: hypothetical protein ABR575_04720 [Actinomycetota bacterium]
MDEAEVRQHAQSHGDAVVAGDLQSAGAVLTPEAVAQAGGVMRLLPRPATTAEVTAVEPTSEGWRATIRYAGDGGDVVVESLWEERDGAARIVDLRVP